MKRPTALRAFGALVLALAAFSGGALTAVLRGWGSSLVFVVIHNKSGAEVRSVNLSVTSCGAISKLSAGALAPGQTHTFRIPVCGEGGYVLEAAFAAGGTLKSAAYVESGYSMSEEIEQSSIRSHARFYHL